MCAINADRAEHSQVQPHSAGTALVTHGLQTQILIEFKVQHRFGWNSYLFTPGQDLGAQASCGAYGRADRCALPAADNGADQSSKGRTAAHHDCRLLVRANALSVFRASHSMESRWPAVREFLHLPEDS